MSSCVGHHVKYGIDQMRRPRDLPPKAAFCPREAIINKHEHVQTSTDMGEINIFIYIFDIEYNGWVSGGRFGREMMFLHEKGTWKIQVFSSSVSVIIQLTAKLYRFKMSSSPSH